MGASGTIGTAIHWEGEAGEPILLVAGPPTSARLFRGVQARLSPRRTGAIELVAGPAVTRVEELVDRLAAACMAHGAEVLVAHGLAVPLALHLPRAAVARVVLSNGPVDALHPVLRGLAALPPALWTRLLLRPGLSGRWLASSAALRRAVVNPYVMGRDTVDALLEALVDDPIHRANTAVWITQVARLLPPSAARTEGLDAVWGDRDPLHPVARIEALFQRQAGHRLVHIPGGRWLHAEERPWALADAIGDLLDPQTTT